MQRICGPIYESVNGQEGDSRYAFENVDKYVAFVPLTLGRQVVLVDGEVETSQKGGSGADTLPGGSTPAGAGLLGPTDRTLHDTWSRGMSDQLACAPAAQAD